MNRKLLLAIITVFSAVILAVVISAAVLIIILAVKKETVSCALANRNCLSLYGQYGAERDWQQQIIYMMMMDRFQNGDTSNDRAGFARCFDSTNPRYYHGGDFKGIQQRIGYLKNLGISTVWPTPVYEQIRAVVGDDCPYHGYSPNFDLPASSKLEPKLGSSEDFKNLLEELHKNGMRYLIDMIINHSGIWAPLVTKRPTWFHPSNHWCEPPVNGVIRCKSPNESWPDLTRNCMSKHPAVIYCPLYDLPDFAQENPEASQYLVDTHAMYMKEFDIDGIRMDTARHVEAAYFKNTWIPVIRNVKSNIFMVGESFYDNWQIPELILEPYIRAGFDSMFNFPLRSALEDVFVRDAPPQRIRYVIRETIYTFGIHRTLFMTNFLGNHDMPRFLRKLQLQIGSIYNPENVRKIRHQFKLALLTLFTLPGIPQLYYGDEIGMMGGNDTSDDSQYRWDMPSWAWSEVTRLAQRNRITPGYLPDPHRTYSMVQNILSLRSSNPALYSGYYADLYSNDYLRTIAFFRAYEGSRIVVIINTSPEATGPITVPIRSIGDVHDSDKNALRDGTVFVDMAAAGADSSVTVFEGSLTLNMSANSIGVYVQQ